MRTLILALLLAGPLAAEPVTPAVGSEERAALLDPLRAVAGLSMGGPIEFVVDDLRAEGDRAFALLKAQRPGGAEIDLARTPMVLRDGANVEEIDGPFVSAALYRAAGHWYVSHLAIGPTDAWWLDPSDCDVTAPFFPQVCD